MARSASARRTGLPVITSNRSSSFCPIRKSAALCLIFCAGLVPSAHAQMKWTDKGFANVTVGGQTGSHTLETSTTFDLSQQESHRHR